MSTDYLRHIAKELKDAGVDKITPEQLDELAYYLDVEQVSKQLEHVADSENETNQED